MPSSRETSRPRDPRTVADATRSARRLAAFEVLLSGVSALFVNALPSEIDALICEAIRRVVEFLGADRGSLVIFSSDWREITLTHNWSRPSLPLRHDRYAMESFPWTNAQILKQRRVVFRSLDALPRTAATDRVSFAEAQVQSMAAIPLVAAGRVMGALAFVTIDQRHTWPPRILRRLALLAEVFSSALARRETAASLDERIAFEALIVDVSAACVRMPGGDLDALVTTALGRVGERLGADRVSLVAVTLDRQDLIVTHCHALPTLPRTPNGPLRRMFPWGWGHVVERGKAMVFSSRDELPPQASVERLTFEGSGNVLSHASVPLTLDGEVRWVLALDCIRRARRWPPEILLRIRLLGEVLATAIERRRGHDALAQRERLLRRSQNQQRVLVARLFYAQEEERRLLARELHDALTPELASMAMDLARIRQAHLQATTGVRSELGRIETRLRDLSGLAHGLSRALHPAVLDDLGLSKAVESECAAYESRTGIRVAVEVHPLPRQLRDGLAIGLFRILQEGLHNIEKHARATSVQVRLKLSRARLRLVVADDGVGFDPGLRRGSPALGLKHVSERARLLGGAAEVRSRAGHGATLEVHVPLR